MDIADALMRFGLTRQEAAVFLRLCSGGPQNGYEIAKATGISRSNAYSALAGLAEKGAADTQEGTPVRYSAVAPKEFCGTRIRELQEIQETLEDALPVRGSDPGTAYQTLRGSRHIAARMRSMLESVNERVYLSVPGPQLEDLLPLLAGLVAIGRKVVILAADPPELPGAVLYRRPDANGRVRLIVDSRLVLTGTLTDGQPTCLYSGDVHLVELFKDAMRNEIRLIESEA